MIQNTQNKHNFEEGFEIEKLLKIQVRCQNAVEVPSRTTQFSPQHGAFCTPSSSSSFGTILKQDHDVCPLLFFRARGCLDLPCMCSSMQIVKEREAALVGYMDTGV